jgi:short subunit dehydrogenase-like uncharacterized protein
MSAATNSTRSHDVVIFGATGFVGRLVSEYLAEHAPDGVRIALAGRSRQRLVEVRATLPPRARDWPLVVADVADPSSLRELAESTTALASTVGPYLRYGLPVVQACADAGTHYADLTGEVLFVRKAIDAVDARARETGARIVTACGYDSIPSDLGVLLLHERAVADAAGGLLDTTLHAKSKGGLSGGTIDSSRAQLEAVGEDKALRKVIFDPYALSPDRAAEPDWARSVTPGRSSPTPRQANGSGHSSWLASTRESSGAATRCGTTPTVDASATARSAPTAGDCGDDDRRPCSPV